MPKRAAVERLANQALIAQSSAHTNTFAEIGKVALRFGTRLVPAKLGMPWRSRAYCRFAAENPCIGDSIPPWATTVIGLAAIATTNVALPALRRGYALRLSASLRRSAFPALGERLGIVPVNILR